VGAYYYPWYGPDRHWNEGYVHMPELGLYNSRSQDVIDQHIEWAYDHGIDFFLMSWWGPRSWEDVTIKNNFLRNPNASSTRFAILYESEGRLGMVDETIDLDLPENRSTLFSDFDYLARNYFDEPGYLRIDGRPVVFLYLTRVFDGDVNGVMQELRDRMPDGLYIIGDEVYWGSPYGMHFSDTYDAVTSYNMHTSLPWINDNFPGRVEAQYDAWQARAESLGIDFIPGILPGYDDTHVRPTEHHPVIPRSPDLLREMCEYSLDYGEPGDEYIDILVSTFNEWHEDTQVEPSQEEGGAYLNIIEECAGQ
jgi:hypothetical protein